MIRNLPTRDCVTLTICYSQVVTQNKKCFYDFLTSMKVLYFILEKFLESLKKKD